MKIRCECGGVIYDQTDWIPYKARFVADQDWEDVNYPDAEYPDNGSAEGGVAAVDEPEERIRECLHEWSRLMWQCEECGSLYVTDRENRIHRFRPATADAPRDIFASVHGERWKRPLRGSWRPRVAAMMQEPPGYLWWSGEGDSGYEQFDSREELERRYHEVFQRLLDKGVLRDALLSDGERQVHRWPTPSPDTDSRSRP